MKNQIITLAATMIFTTGMCVAQTSSDQTSPDQSTGASSSQSTSSQSTSKHKGHKGATAADATASGGKMGKMDEMFMMKAAQGGEAEVELGKMATQKAENDQVKQFGQRMVDDHSRADQELQSLAGQKGVTLPTGLGRKDQATKDRLGNLSGAAFDKAYMRDMVKDHKKDIAEFQSNAKTGKDSDLKNWTEKTLPMLQDHLKQADSTASAIGASSGTATSGKKGKAVKSSTSTQ